MKPKTFRRRIDVNVDELDRIITAAMQAPLSEAEGKTLRTAVHAMAERLMPRRSSEKTRAVLETATAEAVQADTDTTKPIEPATAKGHGRHGAAAFTGATRVDIRHATLHSGDRCPACNEGRVYRQKEPATLVRIVGRAPLEATVFAMERLRCNACLQMFTAGKPEDVGPGKFDATATATVALLKYSTGMPFNRLARLEKQMGIPLPAATQWELMDAGAKVIRPALNHLIRQAAQGGVMHNDDTGMRILKLPREPGDKRTGTFTSGIVSICGGRQIALYFTGPKHAGENLAELLRKRQPGLPPPIQMCDALSRNTPKLTGIEILLCNCMAHGRRQFTEVAESFPEECRHVLESLGAVYGFDAETKARGMTPEERLQFHQAHSGPVMDELHKWMEAQFAEHRTEPNSGLGKAFSYLLRHWMKLTLFLRQAGAPIDNNIVERSLKMAIMNCKNALFYKTLNGARVGDLFMSLIHTCELNGANPFDYLTELLRHPAELAANPSRWMPWNYRTKEVRNEPSAAA
jgi:transposase